MGFRDFREKYWWKNFIHKLYSWGASVVLVGALFKITHWPGATAMLTVGLLTEAFIFFISGLEPPHEEYDWTLVFPELAGVTDEEELTKSVGTGKSRLMGGGGSELSVEAISKLDAMLEKAGSDNLFERLHEGLEKLNQNVNSLKNITDVGAVTSEFTTSVKAAAEKAQELGNTFEKSSENVSYATDNVSDSLNKMSQIVNNQNQEFENAYQKLTSALNIDMTGLADGYKQYNDSITTLNKNLAAVNAIFEMQLEEVNLEDMVTKIGESVKYADKYSAEMERLSKQLEALNDVYGKMLTAMNVKVD